VAVVPLGGGGCRCPRSHEGYRGPEGVGVNRAGGGAHLHPSLHPPTKGVCAPIVAALGDH
jgi:hypothetical protein